jgi:hypothetical protein
MYFVMLIDFSFMFMETFMIYALKTTGKYVFRLPKQSVTFCFTHGVYLWVSYDSLNKQSALTDWSL